MARPKTRRSPRSNRIPRCSYREDGRQCLRNGLGNPPLCRSHQLLLQAYAEQNEVRGAGLGALADVLAGRPISRQVIHDILEELGTLFGRGRVDPRMPPGHVRSGRPPPRRVPPPPSGPPPEEMERQRRILLARQELGFQPREPITQEMVERRRKEMARKHHPDLGGSVDRMARINQAADILLEAGNLG